MSLSNFLKNTNDSPRLTKVAVGIAAAVSAMAVLAACGGPSAPDPTPTARVVYVYATPEHTPSPVPTNTPEPTATPKPQPTPLPTATSLPVATPTPEVNDYYVVIHPTKNNDDGRGGISFYANYPDFKQGKIVLPFHNDDDFLSYLVRESVITSKQKDTYFKGERIPASLLGVSNAVYKMIQNEGIFKFREHFRVDRLEYLLTHYADKSSSGSNGNVLGGKISIEGSEGYVTISDGKISVSAVDDDGNTTTVDVEGVSAKELLDYWLSRNKITIEQKNEYGETGEIQFSLKDGADLLDFDYSSDGASSIGLDKDVQNKIVNEILPLFSSD